MHPIREDTEAPEPVGHPGLPRWVLQGIRPAGPMRIAPDLIAGATLAALAIPEVMGYTRIAGTPVVTGLYTLLVPALLFALFGSSRHLVVGADSATAAIMASTLTAFALAGSSQWMQLAGVLALACAGLLLMARVARLAFLADFLSRTVLAGFLTGVGVQVALGELPGIFGIEAHGDGTLAKLANTLSRMAEFNYSDALMAAAVLLFTIAARRFSPKLPGALVAVAGAIATSWAFGLDRMGISLVGPIQGGLPTFALPDLGPAREHISELASAAFAMTIVILAQSAATARAYAWKYDEEFSENVDLVGLSLANAGAALSGAFVVNGSPTKTQMVDSAGGRSQLAHLTMAAIVLVVLLFLTGPIAFLPRAALAAIVLLIGVDLIHARELGRIRAARPSEFWVAIATSAAVVVLGVERGIVLAMVLSLIDHVRRGYRPHNSLIVRGADGHAQLVPVEHANEYAPGLLVYRFNHSMYYANAEVLSGEVTALVEAASPPLRWFVVDLGAVDDVDFSAGAALSSLRASLAARQVAMKFMRPSSAVCDQLHRYGVLGHDQDAVLASLRDMRHRYDTSTGAPAADPGAQPPGGSASEGR
ncbi:MAG: SulP family inorganic anion transporter [Rhizobacter sp.]|nr:SulP family inorganic anion transporter [Rhizobacter sp.]